MIPQRVAIEGFLSYRDQVELLFDEARVWMLTGENGAGKSSVFDAITYALYGVHRGGKDDVEELINRQCDSLAVEFDFVLGDDRYRVQRTVARNGSLTCQATHLSGPNPPSHNRIGPQPVPGTHTKAGLSRWVQVQLGLDSKAFKMSVLLEQGKSDALLSAEPKERHELLSQLVDLGRYEALEKRAKERQAEAKETVKRNKLELETLPAVTDAEIATQEERMAGAKAQIDAAQQRVQSLQALIVYAKRWSDLSGQREQGRQTLEAMRTLIADQGRIEGAAWRLSELQKSVPALQRILKHLDAQKRYRLEAENYRRDGEKLTAEVTQMTPRLEDAQRAMAQLQQEREAALTAENGALERLSTLAFSIHQLDDMKSHRQQIALCDEQLAAFSGDLDRQVAESQQAVDELNNLRALLPDAKSYLAARQVWRKATKELQDLLVAGEEHSERVAEAATRLEQAQTEVAQAREHAGSAQSQKAVAESELKTAKEQLQRFAQVGTKPTCPYCGQVLSKEHLVAEHTRLEKVLADCTAAAHQAVGMDATRQKALQIAEMGQQVCEQQHAQALHTQREGVARTQVLTNERSRAEADGCQAIGSLRENKECLIPLPQVAEISLCFGEPEPSAENLAALTTRSQGFVAAQNSLKSLLQHVSERDRHQTSRQQYENQYHVLAATYLEARAQQIRADNKLAEDEKEEARSKMLTLTPAFEKARGQWLSLDQTRQGALKRCQEAEQNERTAERLAEGEQTNAAQEIEPLPSAWQEYARCIDNEQIAKWQAEIASLHGADERYEGLRQARSQIAIVETQYAQLESELAEIPQEARSSVESLRQEETQARACQKQGEEEHQRSVGELRTLKDRRQRIHTLSVATRVAEKSVAHSNLLVKFLGRDYLQRFLLQQAESTIVAAANEVLDHCSGGMLSMELRPNEEGGGKQKAFELMVENRAILSTRDKMLPAWLLSGSQRFRVAISLALGIGQYASHNGRRIESVIIDEGFGSLDRQGLRDMQEALRDLSGLLGRIILVSHQAEFAHAFPHRYAIQLVNGASQARLADETDLS